MCGRTVTLVVGPFIGFILGLRSQFDHEPVSRDFGDDGCGGDGGAVPVAFHFGGDVRWHRHVRRVEGVQRLGDVVVIGSKAAEATGRNPGASSPIMVIAITLAALIEGVIP